MSPRAYLAVRLTDLQSQALDTTYLPLYEGIARGLEEIPSLLLHAPHRVTSPEATEPDELSATDIYLLDRVHVCHSDVVIACLELPSLGVGAELQMANEQGIPIVSFHYEQALRGPSRLILGMPSLVGTAREGSTRVVQYSPGHAGAERLIEGLRSRVSEILSRGGRRPRRPQRGIARKLELRRVEMGYSTTDLARLAGVTEEAVERISWAGVRFLEWLGRPEILRVSTFPASDLDEDLVLLPGTSAVWRLFEALQFSEAALTDLMRG